MHTTYTAHNEQSMGLRVQSHQSTHVYTTQELTQEEVDTHMAAYWSGTMYSARQMAVYRVADLMTADKYLGVAVKIEVAVVLLLFLLSLVYHDALSAKA